MSGKYRKLALVLLVFLAVVWGLFYVLEVLPFHIVSTNPKLNNVTVISPFLEVNFNDRLSKDGLSVAASNKAIISSYTVKGKVLTINLQNLHIKSSYKITIRSIKSVYGKQLSNQTLSFATKIANFQQLPADQQKALINSQDNYPKNPLDSDPIIAHLPYSTLDFSMTAQITTQPKVVLNTKIYLSAADSESGDAARQAAISQYEQEAVSYIQSLGLNPANYIINYEIIDS